MRLLLACLWLAPLLGGCTPPAGTPGPALAPDVQAPPPGSRPKLGAEHAVGTTPVPAFRAVGDGWRLQAEGTEGMRLSARLQRAGRGQHNATLVYDPKRAAAAPRTHVLAGTLYGDGEADRAITVTLVREPCRNTEGEQAWRAEVAIAGGGRLVGCADVAT